MDGRTDSRPPPPVPHDADLHGLPWMRLDVIRLLDSDLFALSTGDEFKAAVALWCKSWHQSPGGSLPSDDRVLAHLSGAASRWPKVREMALRGWVEASDGRLYHRVVSELVLIAWAERQQYRKKRGQGAERLRTYRERRKSGESKPPQSLERGPEASVPSSEGAVMAASVTDVKRASESERNDDVTRKRGSGRGNEDIPTTSGAVAPAVADPIFGVGLDFLVRKGTAEKAARSFLGLLRKEMCNRDAEVFELLQRCEHEDVSDPVPWLRKAVEARKRQPRVSGSTPIDLSVGRYVGA